MLRAEECGTSMILFMRASQAKRFDQDLFDKMPGLVNQWRNLLTRP